MVAADRLLEGKAADCCCQRGFICWLKNWTGGPFPMFFSVTHQDDGAPFPRLGSGQALCGERGVQVLRSEQRVGFADSGFFTAAAVMTSVSPDGEKEGRKVGHPPATPSSFL